MSGYCICGQPKLLHEELTDGRSYCSISSCDGYKESNMIYGWNELDDITICPDCGHNAGIHGSHCMHKDKKGESDCRCFWNRAAVRRLSELNNLLEFVIKDGLEMIASNDGDPAGSIALGVLEKVNAERKICDERIKLVYNNQYKRETK